MKYVRPSLVNKAVYESYEIVFAGINLKSKQISIRIEHCDVDDTGTIETSTLEAAIYDVTVKILDPSWIPPDGFIEDDPNTWGDLTPDQIPYIDDPVHKRASIVIENIRSGMKMEEAIIDELVSKEDLPSSEEWSKL